MVGILRVLVDLASVFESVHLRDADQALALLDRMLLLRGSQDMPPSRLELIRNPNASNRSFKP
jgi:hypothetical protein